MPEYHAARRAAVQQRVAALDADAALITSRPNVRYLTGLVSSHAAVLLPADGDAILATDSRYAGTAARDCADLELVIDQKVEPALAERAVREGWLRLAFEAHEMSVERHQTLVEFERLDLVHLGRVVEQLRMVKDESEIGLLQRACAITEEAFSTAIHLIVPGMTEHAFAILLDRAMIDLGAEALAFDSIVASGPNGAIPHHRPGDRAFVTGDLVTIDCGARFGGYHADMTRTIAVGQASGWQLEVYDLVAAAQAAGVAAARPGRSVADVDETARAMISDAGHGGHFSHGLGHGVGLEIHEAPSIGSGKPGTLGDRVPITIEPGIYLPGTGGVRIEDTLVVRAGHGGADAPAQLLTTTTRELLVL
jgi:Xaa-Pro aminopeptidase